MASEAGHDVVAPAGGAKPAFRRALRPRVRTAQMAVRPAPTHCCQENRHQAIESGTDLARVRPMRNPEME